MSSVSSVNSRSLLAGGAVVLCTMGMNLLIRKVIKVVGRRRVAFAPDTLILIRSDRNSRGRYLSDQDIPLVARFSRKFKRVINSIQKNPFRAATAICTGVVLTIMLIKKVTNAAANTLAPSSDLSLEKSFLESEIIRIWCSSSALVY